MTFQDLSTKEQVRWLLTFLRTYPMHHPNHRLICTPVYIRWIISIGYRKIDKLILEIDNEAP